MQFLNNSRKYLNFVKLKFFNCQQFWNNGISHNNCNYSIFKISFLGFWKNSRNILFYYSNIENWTLYNMCGLLRDGVTWLLLLIKIVVIKIVDKHKKSSQNLWESLKQPLYMFFLNKRSNFEKKRTNQVIDPIHCQWNKIV